MTPVGKMSALVSNNNANPPIWGTKKKSQRT